MNLNKGKEFLYLSKANVEEIGLSMADIIVTLEEAFIEKSNGNIEMPPKPGIHTNGDAFIHAMPCWIPKLKSAGLKWVGGYPENQRKRLPYISGVLVLNCPDTGFPLAIMDCIWITAMRTGAVGGLAAKYLANPHSTTVGILGCGVQGRTNLEAILTTTPKINKAYAYDIYPEVAEAYAKEMQKKLNIDIMVTNNPKDAVIHSDIIVTAGPINKNPSPIIEAEWIKEGALGTPVDFDSYWKPNALSSADKYFVDDIKQYEFYHDAGYFKHAPEAMRELGDIIAGKIKGRDHAAEKVISMNLGIAMDDMATAIKIYEKALELDIGTLLPL